MSERTTSAIWVGGIIEALSGAGLDVKSLCAKASIEWGASTDVNAVYPTEQISRLWQLAAEHSGNPAIAFLAAQSVRPAILGVVGYAMMSSANLLAALGRLIQYLRIISSSATVTLSLHDREGVVTLSLHGGDVAVPRSRLEFDLLTVLAFCRWVLGRELRPLAVELTHDVPEDVQPYLQAFHCKPQFNGRSNRVHLARADLESPLLTFHPQLAELHDQFADARIEALDKPQCTYTRRLRPLIVNKLSEGEPGRGAIARELRVTERTLQRRLQSEGTSFHALVDDIRRELAERYLVQTQIPLTEAAYRLGFASQGNFTRACHRWFGMTPGQYRQRTAARDPVATAGL